MSNPKIGFKTKRVRLPLASILPVKQVKNPQKNIHRYPAIRDSIKEAGLVEPLIVYPQKGAPGKYLLLDGHLRYIALKELAKTEVECLVSTDDESYTYNARVSRLSPIQEHKMVKKAIQNGVPPERIAAALNITPGEVRATMTLLDGIHEEAADLLKDKGIFPKALKLLKKVTPVRQIEIAELMVSANNYTSGYAEALVLGSPRSQLLDPEETKKKQGMTPEEIGRLEQEVELLQRDLKGVEESYGENMLNLTLALGYVKKLLENGRVVKFLRDHHGDILAAFERIASGENV